MVTYHSRAVLLTLGIFSQGTTMLNGFTIPFAPAFQAIGTSTFSTCRSTSLFATGKDSIQSKPSFTAGAPRSRSSSTSKRRRRNTNNAQDPTNTNTNTSASASASATPFVQKKDGDEESVARRQLLFSLLASAATTSLIPAAPAAAATIDAVTASATISATLPLQFDPTSVANAFASYPGGKLIIPPLDTRSYESMIMPNGLKVMLCSDPSSTKAAGAMDVHVGATSDPEKVPGLAHFCEHSKLFAVTDLDLDPDLFF